VNPGMFRELEFQATISPDVLNPRSTDLERAYCLEDYDRMVAAPPGMYDPEAVAKFLPGNNPLTKKDPDSYLAKQQTANPQPMQGLMPGQASGAMPNAGNGPLGAMAGKNPLNKAQNAPIAGVA